MKRPAFQFYPADWRKDLELGACSYTARGIWFEMLCIMHEAKPYGHLVRDGRSIPDQAAANLVRVPLPAFKAALIELESNGVFSRTPEGVIYSRRMVKDEAIRNKRAEAGKLGGNPVLLNLRDNHPDNHDPTPSASSASSSELQNHAVLVGSIPAKVSAQNGTSNISTGQKSKGSWRGAPWVNATASTLGMARRTNESDADFADRVHTAANAKRRQDAAKFRKRS